jgi:predicted dehydrogenase
VREKRCREPLGVAIVGAGYWGPNLVRNVQASEESRLLWVCDLDPDRAHKATGRYSTVGITDSLDQVLSDDAVGAVMIATPARTHRDLAMACLAAGRHVLIEKPLAWTLAEGEELVAAARTKGLVLMCDHTYCYTPAVRRIRELIQSGELGDIHYVDSVRINLGLVQPDIDVFWDLAPHDLSILDFILPEGCSPLGVSAQGADPIGAGRACVGYLTLPLKGNAIAHAHMNWLSPTKIRMTIIGGSRRTLVWDDVNPAQRLSLYDRGVERSVDVQEQERRDALISYRTGDMVAPALREAEALQEVVTEFARAVREGRDPLTDGRSGLRVLSVLEASSRSLEANGAMVSLDGLW